MKKGWRDWVHSAWWSEGSGGFHSCHPVLDTERWWRHSLHQGSLWWAVQSFQGKFCLQAQKLLLGDHLKAGTGCLEVWWCFPRWSMQGFVWQCPRSPKALLPTHTGLTTLSGPAQAGLSPHLSFCFSQYSKMLESPRHTVSYPCCTSPPMRYSSNLAVASIKRASLASCQLHPCKKNHTQTQ